MNDMIIKAAQDPSCILAVTPDRGGSWWATLRPDTPRNFKEKPMTWTEFSPDKITINTQHDYEFLIQFSSSGQLPLTDNETQLFYNTDNKMLAGVWIAKDGQIRGYMSVYEYNALMIHEIGEPALSAGIHAIRILAVGNTMSAYLDDELANSAVRNRRTDFSEITSYPISSFDGNILCAKLTDLTTGETVWQASHDELYETNYPWPSAVPRNFAEEPTAFYDCQSICSEKIDPSHDYRFLFDSEIVSDKIECSMFYAGAAGFPFGIYCHPTNQINCFTNMFRVSSSPSSQYTNTSVYNGESRLQGRHVIEMEIAGNSLKTYLDGVLINRPSGFVRTGVATCDLPQCNSGYVYKIQIKDLTTGKTVWSYPSAAERVRLLTKTNVRTDRGVFEAADDAKIAGIATPLDFRGNTASKTFIVHAFCPAHDPASEKLYIHPFFMQGAIHQGTSLYTFQFSLWEDRRSGGTTQLFPAISIGTDSPGANVTGAEIYLDQWHTYAMVIDYNGGNCYIRAFVDGVLLRERTVSGTPAWNTPATTTAQETTVGIRRDPNASYYAGSLTRITAALIFDRALTAAEIAALSPTSN